MGTFTETLRARSEEALLDLLVRRGDLAAPAPTSIGSLAARATSRISLERAVAPLDAFHLHVLEALLALAGPGRPVPGADLRVALGRPGGVIDGEVDAAVHELSDLALVWADRDGALHAAPGLGDVLGPYPAGLGPPLADTLTPREAEQLRALLEGLGLGLGDGLVADRLTDPGVVHQILAAAPDGAAQVLDALTWHPVGRLDGATTGAAGGPGPRVAVQWLLRHGLLVALDPAHVVLPREVALALRGGRTHRGAGDVPPSPAGVLRQTVTVAAESAQSAQEITRLVADLLQAWETDPPRVLRSGALGARDLRRTAARWDTDEAVTALVVELAGAAGLVADDGQEPPAFGLTPAVDDWLAAELPERWAALALAWWTTDRTPWMVGTRDERGGLRPALHPELRRSWAPRVRRTVLQVLADVPTGTALPPANLLDVLRWRAPRSVPAEHAVHAVLEEAERLGVLGAGALAPAGRALLDAGGSRAVERAVAAALAAQLPPPVDELLLQGDLTGIVPGRPGATLAALLERASQVESRGAATTVRFTAETIRTALDHGQSAEELLTDLARHSRTPVPQALDYLVRDVARRHGALRVGQAWSYLRAQDATVVTAAIGDPRLAGLGLVRLAPTVAAAQVEPAALLRALRDAGLAPVAEGPDGQVVVPDASNSRARTGRRRRRATSAVAAEPASRSLDTARAALARLRAADAPAAQPSTGRAVPSDQAVPPDRSMPLGQAEPPDPIGPADQAAASGQAPSPSPAAVSPGTPDPVGALALLREAAADRRTVWLEMVGAHGALVRRRVLPIRVDGGRARVVDVERESEITVAVHRILCVSPLGSDDPGPDNT